MPSRGGLGKSTPDLSTPDLSTRDPSTPDPSTRVLDFFALFAAFFAAFCASFNSFFLLPKVAVLPLRWWLGPRSLFFVTVRT